ncbi:MAG: hypothetical protein KKE30_09815 [Gammaproteobacteria bacterium]|nr:hypothetical protein [Gammaproteobacteria bacterium]MBU1553750.1 hypothetical protein [Gammaproteobacteria bacterium]MBU2068704.1 hypothetical protein [Gammaproteobacteria bacterium]MBU2183692.1 hypothetical protein [Gammaproteobacteria bacterium]MBU2205911.1 hypothetical protein [Gammaproteobacteria bacterium]
MKQVPIFIAATLIVVIEITLISTVWVFAPSVMHDPAGYLINQALFYAFFVALVTGIIVLVVGLPTYFVLDYKSKSSQVNLALVGAIIPVVILFLIMWVTSSGGNGSYSSGQNYYGTYREMVVNNERTLWGWISVIEQFITYSIYGLIGATTFGKAISVMRSRYKNA